MKDIAALGARILLAILFVVTGLGKLVDPSMVATALGGMGLPAPSLLTHLIGLCEVVGGVAVLIGFRVDVVGWLLAGWCVLTALVIHLHMPMDLMKNLGLAGGFILLAVSGAGALSIDRRPAAAS